MKIRANYHTHTVFCDGTNTAEEMVCQAIALGFEHLGFSGHIDDFAEVDKEKYFPEIKRLEAKYGDRIEILHGIELDNLRKPEEAAGAEYIIGSTHYLNVPAVDGKPVSVDGHAENVKFLADEYFGGDYYKLSAAYYDFEAQVYDRLHPTFIGHFDLITRFNDLPPQQGGHFLDEGDPRYIKPALEAMEYLVSRGMPFEINCGAINRKRKLEPYPAPRLLRALHDFGGEILISSDAHQKELLDGCFDIAVERARAAGFKHINILTRDGTQPSARPANAALYWVEVPIDKL